MEYRKKNSQKKTPAKIGRQIGVLSGEKSGGYITIWAVVVIFQERTGKPATENRAHFEQGPALSKIG